MRSDSLDGLLADGEISTPDDLDLDLELELDNSYNYNVLFETDSSSLIDDNDSSLSLSGRKDVLAWSSRRSSALASASALELEVCSRPETPLAKYFGSRNSLGRDELVAAARDAGLEKRKGHRECDDHVEAEDGWLHRAVRVAVECLQRTLESGQGEEKEDYDGRMG